MRDTIQGGVDSGEFHCDVDVGEVASIIFAAADGLTFHFATSGVSFDWGRMNRVLLDLVLNGIRRR